MNGGAPPDMVPWGNRNHGNHGNGNEALLDQMQAVLAQREWQWSPEYSDGLQDGDTRQAGRNGAPNGAPRRARPAKTGTNGPVPVGVSGPIAAQPGSANGRPHQMPPALQHLLLNGDGPQGP